MLQLFSKSAKSVIFELSQSLRFSLPKMRRCIQALHYYLILYFREVRRARTQALRERRRGGGGGGDGSVGDGDGDSEIGEIGGGSGVGSAARRGRPAKRDVKGATSFLPSTKEHGGEVKRSGSTVDAEISGEAIAEINLPDEFAWGLLTFVEVILQVSDHRRGWRWEECGGDKERTGL